MANEHGGRGVHGSHGVLGGLGGHGGRGFQNVHVHYVDEIFEVIFVGQKILWPWCQGLVDWQNTNLVPFTGIGPQAGA